MAVNAKFTADFSSFLDAIDKAEVALVDFGKGAGKVETSLNKMVDNFSGRKLIQEASLMTIAVEKAGGISALTAKELENVGNRANEAADKMKRLGYEVPAGLQKLADETKATTGTFSEMMGIASQLAGVFGIAFGVDALVSFAKEAIASTARLEDLSIATGISADGLQRLGQVGRDFGIDTELMARGVEQLSAKLAGGDKNATAAVELLGLNLKELLAAGPEEAFIQIAEAAGRIDDPMTKGAIAADLFGGRLGKQLIPLLSDLRVKLNDVPRDAIISDANITKAHDFEVGLDHVTTKLKSYTATIFGGLSSYNAWLESGTGLTGFLDLLHGKTVVASKDVVAHAQAVESAVPATIHLTETVKDHIEAQRKAEEEAKKFDAAMVELNATGIAWQGTLDTLDGSVAEAIKYYLEAGVSQKTLADAYGVTAVQVKAVSSELAEEQKQLKLSAASVEEVSKLWDEFNQLASKGGTAFDNQIAAIDRWALDLEAKAQKAGTDTAAFYEALTALWNAKLHDAAMHTEAAMQHTASSAISSFDAMNASVMGIASSFDGWNQSIMRVDSSLRKLSQGNTIDTATAAQDPRIRDLLKAGWSLKNAEAIKLSQDWGFAPQLFDNLGNPETSPSRGERVPGYFMGVRNAPGGWSMVGERGPEAMYVPKGASILPSGTMPNSGPQVIQLVVDGRTLASIVNDANTRSMKQGRQFPSN